MFIFPLLTPHFKGTYLLFEILYKNHFWGAGGKKKEPVFGITKIRFTALSSYLLWISYIKICSNKEGINLKFDSAKLNL